MRVAPQQFARCRDKLLNFTQAGCYHSAARRNKLFTPLDALKDATLDSKGRSRLKPAEVYPAPRKELPFFLMQNWWGQVGTRAGGLQEFGDYADATESLSG